MRRWTLLLAAAALMAMLTPNETDLGNLRPAAVLWIRENGGEIFAETDLEDRGHGATLELALENMKRTAPGAVFLETVQYLMMDEKIRDLLPRLEGYLRPTVRICAVAGDQDIKEAEKYLTMWKPAGTLAERVWERLQRTEDGYRLEKWE